MRSNTLFSFLVCTGVVLASTAAHAQLQNYSLSSDIQFSVSNTDYPGSNNDLWFAILDSASNATSAVTSLTSNFSFTGLDAFGDEQTMTFDGTGVAQAAGFGILKTGYSGTLWNTFYNSENTPYIDSSTITIDPEGVPDIFDGRATASFTDLLQFGGTAVGYKAVYVFGITGVNSGDSSWSRLSFAIAGNYESFDLDDPGVSNYVLRSQAYDISSSGQTAEVSLSSTFQPQTQSYNSGSTVTGSSDFFNTVQLIGLEVYDAQGNLASNVTITGESGTQYNAVPEPATMSLLALWAWRKRRKNRA